GEPPTLIIQICWRPEGPRSLSPGHRPGFQRWNTMSKLAGKVAVITGGGSGVGKSTAALFLKEGAKVVIAGRDAAKLDAVAKELNGGAGLRAHATDVGDAGQCQGLIDFATKAFGRIDILVNNAGTNLKERTMRE